MANLRDIRIWRERLGLLPVPLFGAADPGSYVLLNGTRGSFCLYVDRRIQDDSRSEAWSANVGHTVNIHEDGIYVQRWDQPSSSARERHSISEVSADLEGFHRALEKTSPPSELSIIAHAVKVFRILRATLGRGYSGDAALQAFLFLVAAAIECVDRQRVDLDRWQLSPDARDIALTVDEPTWEAIVGDLLSGSQLHNLKAHLDLTLRHASGMLFQEAHYAAIFEPVDQLLFPGFTPRPVALQAKSPAVGLHFTPPAIVRSIVEEALIASGNHLMLIIFDPACGSGEFLREALRQLELKNFSGRVRLIGFDISPAACAMADFTLAWESRGMVDRVDIEIIRCDALDPATVWPTNVNIILMNPPFQSWQDMPSEVREEVRRQLGDFYKYRPDLSAVFLWKALQSLANDGILGSILPALFLEGEAFSELREVLADNLNTLVVARLGSHSLFYAALVDACFYIGRRGAAEGVPVALWASHRPHSTSAALRTLRRFRTIERAVLTPIYSEAEDFSLYQNPDLGKKGASWSPRPYREWQIAQQVKGLPTVGDRFQVKQGALTGLNRVFILTKSEWLRLPEEERPFFRPAVFHESLRGGRFYDESYVFYPYGAYAITTEPELRNLVATYYRERLADNKSDLLNRHGSVPDRWWLLARPREWQAKPVAKIVTAYFGDTGSFAWDAEGSLVVVQGYSWVPKAKKNGRLRRQVWLSYLALINSDIFSALLAAHSHHVSGGQWNLSKRYVESMPLPDLDAAAASEIRTTLAEVGALIHAEGLDSLSKDQLVRLKEFAEAAYFRAEI